MAELKKRIDEEFPAAELATDGIPPKQPEGPKLVKGQEAETLDCAVAVSEPMPLFSESESEDFRLQWSNLQTGFVDEPRRTVEGADKLVASVIQRLAEGFANERAGLEKQWDGGANVLAGCPAALSLLFWQTAETIRTNTLLDAGNLSPTNGASATRETHV